MARIGRMLLIVALCAASLLAGAAPAAADDAGAALDPSMAALWERTDQPVADGSVNRSWMWGPQANAIVREPYTYAPLAEQGNQRLVAYFDKSRMEINDPAGDSASVWHVSNGRLAWELMTGKVQIGQDPDQYTYGLPAMIPVAGDPYNYTTPTYRTMGQLLAGAPDRTGELLTATVDANGVVGADLAPAADVRAAMYISYPGADGPVGHNVPDVFWTFLTQSISPIVAPADWLFVAGYPLTEAYWTLSTVNNTTTDVLVQCFERRCLTYTPANNDPYKVEMGNVGQHYYQWRYGGYGSACYATALRGFGLLWQQQDQLRAAIGCPNPYATSDAIATAYEPFEHGAMLWVSIPDPYSPIQSVLALYDDGTYAAYQDAWVDGDPLDDPGIVPPAGLYQPQRGFGKIWREAPGVRERLGWALAPETGSAGESQGFDYGFMIRVDALNQIVVGIGSLGWTATGAWQRYPDPYVAGS